MLFFLPLIALGAMVLCRRPPSAATSGPRAISGSAPSPLLVLDGFMRMGQIPPPQVILCAIAEAELMGRVDVANDLVLAFVIPVLEGDGYRPLAVPTYGPLPNAQPPSYPQARLPARRAPVAPPQYASPPYAIPQYGDAQYGDAQYAGAPYAGAAYANESRWAADATDADGRGMPSDGAAWPVPPPAPLASTPPADGRRGSPRAIARSEDARVEILSRPTTAPSSRHAGTITVSGRSSPIEGIGTEEWGSFIGRVSREVPTFTTSRHVGQFRQRKDRLAELGIDPAKILNSPDAQVAAFEQDMCDAYAHANQSGLVSDHLGETVSIPMPDGSEAAAKITLSGMLGIIQAAGLEGAAQWLEVPADRRRFPNTTQAFTRTNGVF